MLLFIKKKPYKWFWVFRVYFFFFPITCVYLVISRWCLKDKIGHGCSNFPFVNGMGYNILKRAFKKTWHSTKEKLVALSMPNIDSNQQAQV